MDPKTTPGDIDARFAPRLVRHRTVGAPPATLPAIDDDESECDIYVRSVDGYVDAYEVSICIHHKCGLKQLKVFRGTHVDVGVLRGTLAYPAWPTDGDAP